MKTYALVKKSTYQDSMKLMQLQAALSEIPGIIVAGVAMGTHENKLQFEAAGLLTKEVEDAGTDDLLLVVKAESQEGISSAVARIEQYFHPREGINDYAGGEPQILPKSISSALKRQPDANLAVISLPGRYAALEAMNALQNGLHVFLFSDNVPLEDEIRLKVFADSKGLLVMGPDCGTAIVGGIPLGFSNVIRRGRIGIIAASGSGMQEVTCLINRMGEGISQAIGTGGRDLSNEVGGRTFQAALSPVLQDPQTEVLIMMSKYCDHDLVNRFLESTAKSAKEIVACFPGLTDFLSDSYKNIHFVADFQHAAALSVALVRKEPLPPPLTKENLSKEMGELIQSESRRFSAKQKYVRAFLGGGSFTDQAQVIFKKFFNQVYAFPAHGSSTTLLDPFHSLGHTIVDMGDDFFTHNKLHPMIDLTARVKRLSEEFKDEEIRVILIDVVLGYAAHPDPAGTLRKVILEGKRIFSKQRNYLSVVVHLCGTEGDMQNYLRQKELFESSGSIVVDSSTKAALLACLIGSA